MAWNNNPIRRGQLIMPFGPGNLFVSKNGTSMMIAGIDHWFNNPKIKEKEFVINDWRLEIELGVQEFRLPPDFRTNFFGGSDDNTNLLIPTLRFPTYHLCSNCRLMQRKPLHQVEFAKCRDCDPANKPHQLNQVRFISICQKGHIQDFPWREWVHKSANAECNGDLYYSGGKGASMDSISISCKGCGVKENLSSAIFNAVKGPNQNIESSSLQDLITNIHYKCEGKRPWLGDTKGSECNHPPIGALRAAGNVYFGLTRSSLSLPKSDDALIQSICDEIENDSDLRILLSFLRPFLDRYKSDETSENKKDYEAQLETMSQELSQRLVSVDTGNIGAIKESIVLIINQESRVESPLPENRSMREIAFRREEYEILQNETSHQDLIIETVDIEEYKNDEIYSSLLEGIDHISLVKKLVETTALEGFTRLNQSRNDEFKAELLLRENWEKMNKKWLPARQSTGEGIFIRFNETILGNWEKNKTVIDRVKNLQRNISSSLLFNNHEGLASPRHILIHTFAHALINELTYSSGYSTSALRERLYISDDIESPMSGVLIYTASGDSEGSMGGLVMQGRPKTFEKLLMRALTKASWCSHDPVCAIGKDTGPDSCNNSACYSCCLVPEPSCEFSNAGLDRALLGTRAVGYKDLGYFIPLEER